MAGTSSRRWLAADGWMDGSNPIFDNVRAGSKDKACQQELACGICRRRQRQTYAEVSATIPSTVLLSMSWPGSCASSSTSSSVRAASVSPIILGFDGCQYNLRALPVLSVYRSGLSPARRSTFARALSRSSSGWLLLLASAWPKRLPNFDWVKIRQAGRQSSAQIAAVSCRSKQQHLV